MDYEHKALFLKEATRAYKEVTRTADIVIKHYKTCKVCGSRFMRTFFRCHDLENVAFDYLAAKVDADQYTQQLKLVQMEIEESLVPDPEWLEGLYNLKDKRSE